GPACHTARVKVLELSDTTRSYSSCRMQASTAAGWSDRGRGILKTVDGLSQVSKGGVMIQEDILDLFRLKPGKKVRLKDHDTGWAQTRELKELGKDVVKERTREILSKNLEDLAEAQELLYADDRYALLIVLQAMDAAGKDGTIKHVMSGVNPQGCQVFSFKKP